MKNQKGPNPLVIALVIVAGVILFAPLPQYRQLVCYEAAPPICNPAGWRLGPSLWDGLAGKATQTAQQSIPSPTPDASREPTGSGETTNWKTYTSTDNSYSFKYPSQWYIENPSSTSGLSFFQTGVTPKHSTSGVLGNATLVTIDYSWQKFDNLKSQIFADGSPVSTEITLSGKRSLRSEYLMSADILIKHLDNGNDRILNIRVTDAKNIQFLDQILSTFRFD